MRTFYALIFFFVFFAHKKLKKPPSKVAHKNSNPFFFLTALTAQTAQTKEFIFQNVVYRPTVYRTGQTTLPNLQNETYLFEWLLNMYYGTGGQLFSCGLMNLHSHLSILDEVDY